MSSRRHLSAVPPGHGEPDGPGPMPRCPICASVVDPLPAPHSAAGGSLRADLEAGICQTHGQVVVVYGTRDAILSRAREADDGAA